MQDYQAVEFINRVLRQDSNGKALVFMRHLYYLDVPYLNGDPTSGFEIDPAHLQSAQDWRVFFASKNIEYVVRSPQYPWAVVESLSELEKGGDLVPVAQTNVQNFQGNRIDQRLATSPVVILQLNSQAAARSPKTSESANRTQ